MSIFLLLCLPLLVYFYFSSVSFQHCAFVWQCGWKNKNQRVIFAGESRGGGVLTFWLMASFKRIQLFCLLMPNRTFLLRMIKCGVGSKWIIRVLWAEYSTSSIVNSSLVISHHSHSLCQWARESVCYCDVVSVKCIVSCWCLADMLPFYSLGLLFLSVSRFYMKSLHNRWANCYITQRKVVNIIFLCASLLGRMVPAACKLLLLLHSRFYSINSFVITSTKP